MSLLADVLINVDFCLFAGWQLSLILGGYIDAVADTLNVHDNHVRQLFAYYPRKCRNH